MKKKGNTKSVSEKPVKTNLTFEQLMKKALTTPLPQKGKKKKKGNNNRGLKSR